MAPISSSIRRFANLRKAHPELSDSMLLNSNNRTSFTGHADVVIAGAGLIGLCYAIRLKNLSPHLKIEVFEKSPAPIQKIGESTLSSFTKFVNGEIIPPEYLLRLFGLKDGLQFYCIDQDGLKITAQDVGGLDISFQLDRRVSELFFTMWAQHIGINVYHGVDIRFKLPIAARDSVKKSSNESITPPQVNLTDPSGLVGNQINTRLVCDATGFSRGLTSKFGKREKYPGWNTNAYWAYFSEKPHAEGASHMEHWDYPATKHVCFPEGWGWFIKLISWHHAPLCNLMDLIDYIIGCANRGIPTEDLPCVQDLSRMFDCPFEFITSIGWAVRDDHKLPECLEAYGKTEGEQKFKYFQKRYPSLDKLMSENYNLLPGYYDGRTYFVKKTLAYRSPIVAGEGWLAVGNSAGFTNPLISPGINAGIGSAFYAAELSQKILSADPRESSQIMRESVKAYQAYVHDYMHPCLHQMNRFWYAMFRDQRLFEALVRCFWCLGVEDIEAGYRATFTEEDLRWLVGAGGDDFQRLCKKVLDILPSRDDDLLDEKAVVLVQTLSQQCLQLHSQMHPNKWGRYLREYDDTLQRTSGKKLRDTGARYFAVRCLSCNYWMFNFSHECSICGSERPRFKSLQAQREF